MVKLIPVLVANSVSRNIVPGILKSIETYTMIYDLDKLLDDAKKDIGIGKQSKVVRNKLVIKEGEDEIVNFLTKEILQEQKPFNPYSQYPGGPTGSKGPLFTPVGSTLSASAEEEREKAAAKELGKRDVAGTPDPEEEARKKARGSEIGKRDVSPKDASVSIGQFDMKSLTLEPSWMKADLLTKRGEKYSTLIGVKAIPVAVKSDAKLHELIMWDAQIGKLMQLIIRSGRKFEGFLYRLWSRTAGRIFNADPHAISGNPYKDIVLKRTIISSKYVDKVYFVLNRSDLKPDFFEQAKRVRQLTKLGWQSFIIADDVNRSVSFCMIKFRGMCSTMPYTMLYQTMNQAKIFDDLEDVRRSSASLFKSRRPFKKIVAEGMAEQKLEEFTAEVFPEKGDTELLNELELLDESFAGFIKKAMKSPKVLTNRILKRNIKLPSVGAERIAKYGNKVDPDFHKAYKLSQKVIGNSLEKVQNESLINWAAMIVVIKGYTLKGSKNLLYGTREALKYFIPKIRKIVRESAKTTLKIPPEHMAQVAFGTAVLFSSFAMVTWIVTHAIKGSFEVARTVKGTVSSLFHYDPGSAKTVKEIALHMKELVTSQGGNGTKLVNDSKAVADDFVSKTTEQGKDLAASSEEWGMFLGIALIAMGMIGATMATIKGK